MNRIGPIELIQQIELRVIELDRKSEFRHVCPKCNCLEVKYATRLYTQPIEHISVNFNCLMR